MSFNRIMLLFTFLLIATALHSQEMQKGFNNLEKGEFAKAEIFFKDILNDYPDNKTARLCYARAVGLSSDPEKAKALFEALLIEYKNDLEIQLNYAESLLWNKEYDEAKSYYEKLVQENPENFGALLGFANTLSNLHEYEDALNMVNRSLTVSLENPNAMNSRKYIRLGYANEQLQQRNYQDALDFLDANLMDYPGDKESLLNKANLYLIVKDGPSAKAVYNELALNLNDSILAFNGISLASHIDEDEKDALYFAEKALDLSEKSKDSLSILSAKERYAQALIWNAKFKSARSYIAKLKTTYPEAAKILALEDTLVMYTGDLKNCITNYK
ncbi:MAG: tetratricopeptide repeat protein, partial [Leeuwenhoekiella sp.]